MAHKHYSPVKSGIINFLKSFPSNKNVEQEIHELYKEGFDYKSIKAFAYAIKDKWSKEQFISWKNRIKYCKQNKIAVMYDATLASLKYGISMDEAELKINNLKTQKATSLAGFQSRHGERRGAELFEKFQKTSKKSSLNIKNFYKEKYPETWQEEYSTFMKRKSKWCKEYYLSRIDCTEEEEAKSMARNYYFEKCGLLPQIYLDKGYSIEEIDVILEKINQRRLSNNRRFPANLKRMHGDKWIDEHIEINKKLRNTMEARGLWVTLAELEDWRKYRLEVSFWTKISLRENPHLAEKRSRQYHVDHKYSQKQGFIDNVPPRVIGSIVNLQILTQLENCSKSSDSCIALCDLITEYNNHENKKNNEIE
jgi:hypothetical protein